MPRMTNIFENESKNPMDNIRVPELFPLHTENWKSIYVQFKQTEKAKQNNNKKFESMKNIH